MTASSNLESLPDQALIAELERRGHVLSVWTPEDFAGPIREDNDLQDRDESFIEGAAAQLGFRIQEGLRDILGQRGNDYLTDRWSELRSEVVAVVDHVPGGPSA